MTSLNIPAWKWQIFICELYACESDPDFWYPRVPRRLWRNRRFRRWLIKAMARE